MPAAPPTPDQSPAKKVAVKTPVYARNSPHTPPLTPAQHRLSTLNVDGLLYDCDNTGDDHEDNRLRFSELVELSIELAVIFRQLPSDYSGVSTQSATDVSIARRLLQRDVKEYRERVSINTAFSERADRVKRNTVLRALTLFSLGSIHATQYIEHSADDRIEWLILLNTSGFAIKPAWERDTALRMIHAMELESHRIERICDPRLIFGAVHNNYFLMLFARLESEELQCEMYTMGVGAYSWFDLLFLRKAYFKQSDKQSN
jgi:hypothetical protein